MSQEEKVQVGQPQASAEAPPVAEAAEKPVKSKTAKPTAAKLAGIIESIEKLTVLELADLVKTLEEKFGVSAAVPVAMMAAAPSAAGASAAAVEEKSEFTVMITSVGDKKIQVIKEVRAVTNLGLKEAKDLVEAAPAVVKENVSKEEAATIKQKLEGAGAKVELK